MPKTSSAVLPNRRICSQPTQQASRGLPPLCVWVGEWTPHPLSHQGSYVREEVAEKTRNVRALAALMSKDTTWPRTRPDLELASTWP